MHKLINNAYGIYSDDGPSCRETNNIREDLNIEIEKLYKLIEDLEQELYLGCRIFSKL
jgi:hypothetical protein